jgi:hypothetical protein
VELDTRDVNRFRGSATSSRLLVAIVHSVKSAKADSPTLELGLGVQYSHLIC